MTEVDLCALIALGNTKYLSKTLLSLSVQYI